jgi:outer membrane protein assembly factor BamD (BamD/ComL family)
LYNPALNRFRSLSPDTPIVRYLELPERIKPLHVKPPLRVLVMISSPVDDNYEPLDVEREWINITHAMQDLQKQKLVIIDRLDEASLPALRRQLRKHDYHIFHFVGHGAFDEYSQDGVMVLENEQKQGELVSGQDLGIILHGHDSLRLAVINACEGARSGVSDPFAGVAQSLVQQGIPAVIAMQFAVTDKAAIAFAHEFYNAITSAYPVDAALAEARRAIYSELKNIEWATPVLFMRSPDGKIFDLPARTGGTEAGAKRPAANLFVRQGAQAGKNFPLHAETYVLGRDETLPISIQDGQISRSHAQIVHNNLGFWMEDLNSTNGTFVNGVKITGKVPLRNKDIIRLGGTTLVFDQEINQRFPVKPLLTSPVPETPDEKEEEKSVKVATLWAEAQAARGQRRWEAAIANLQAILNLDPAHPKARSELTYIQKQQKASNLYDEAQAAEARGDWNTAIARLQAILNLEPGHTAIRNELAQLQQRQKAASLYSESQEALAKNELDLAIAKLQAVLAIEPTHPRARTELGQVQTRQRQQKIDSLYADAQAALAQGNTPLAIAKLQALLAVESAHPRAREELNALLQRQHQERVAGLHNEAQTAQAQENWAMAVAKLQAILALEPGNQKIRFELGQAQKKQKIAALYAEARAAQAQGNWALAVSKLQGVLAVDANLPQARPELENAQKNLQGQRAEALYNQGQAHYQAGRHPQALESFYQIKSLVGEYKDIDSLIGSIEAILGAQNSGPQNASFSPVPSANWPGSVPTPAQPAAPESVGRLYDAPGVDRGQIAEELRQHFFINGYETQVIDQGNALLIQGKKGGVRSWLGMGQAITIMLEDTGNGLKVSIGGGKWVEQGAAIAVGLFVLWPLLLTGGMGMLMQKNLIDTLWRMVENRILTSGGKRVG